MHSHNRSQFGNEHSFHRVIKELEYLSKTGISIQVDGKIYQIYFATMALIGDNLGLNSLLGFSESFTAEFFCRVCRISSKLSAVQCREISELLRTQEITQENYKTDIRELSHGVKGECCFNDIPDFHNIKNPSCDEMHDWKDGRCRNVMATVINTCITKKYFTLERLNNRIKYFNYDEQIDKGNKPPPINSRHLTKKCIIMTAAQMAAFVYYFGMIIGD